VPSRKPHRDTRRQLVESAWALWSTQGLARTSVNAVIAHAGLSKGTFYHWFDSASALLDAVVDLMVERSLARVHASAPARGTALEQLRSYLAASRSWRLANAPGYREVMAALYAPDNRELRQRVQQRTASVAIRELTAILGRGVDDGTVPVDDPALAAEYVVHAGQAIADLQIRDLLAADVERVVRRAELHLSWTESGLGLPPGTLSGLGDDFRSGLMSLLPPEEAP